jgi:hypothetical protein
MRYEIMNLKFRRKLTKSAGNKATQITIPRCVAQAWSEYDALEIVYEGNELKIVPIKGRASVSLNRDSET